MAQFLEVLNELGKTQKAGLLAILFVAIVLGVRRYFKLDYPPNLPRIREAPGSTRFSIKTALAYYIDCKKLWQEAYDTYSKHGKTCLVPGLGFRDEVLAPHSALKWLVSQPDSVMSTNDAFVEVDQVGYTMGNHKFILDPWQGMLVKRDINAVLERIVVSLNQELGFAFDVRFGTDEDHWTELDLYETMRWVVAQGSSRFTVGLPLCRNEEYLRVSMKIGDNFVLTAGAVGVMPKFLRPLVGSLFWIRNYFDLRQFKRLFKPLYDERLAITKAGPRSESEPNDHLQMMFRYAETERPHELSLAEMGPRLALSNVGSFHQTSIGITNVLFNVLESDREFNTIATLRDEIRSVMGADSRWTKAAVAKMVRCDSVLKETLRLHSFGNRSVMRKVIVDGVVTEDGIRLPKGAVVSMLTTSQLDGDTFEDPHKFDPFRYSRMREADPKKGGLSFVSTGKDFLPFGHGKHACPGRFLLEFELKMILAYLLTNYDVELPKEYNGKRPESRWIAEAQFPPEGGRIRVKRRVA
ncbi:putative cytochrome P450 [Bisporella sp. PMI_857]|nr:putative cytochrome P450 [Bisporella sp. PMI_857]